VSTTGPQATSIAACFLLPRAAVASLITVGGRWLRSQRKPGRRRSNWLKVSASWDFFYFQAGRQYSAGRSPTAG
jgi:hypothetical protein